MHGRHMTILWRRCGACARAFMEALIVGALMVSALPAGAQVTGAPGGYKREPGQVSTAIPRALREIGFDQNLEQPVPLDVGLRDEEGRGVQLRKYFGRRPVVMIFAYYDCPMLCSQVIGGLATALDILSLEPGRDFEIVTVSFNPADTPASARARKAVAIGRYKRPGASEAWHFLTGDQPSIDRLTKAAGFRYVWDADTHQFAHPTGVIVLTPDGRLATYMFGIEYGARDLRLAIVEASNGKVGNPVDVLLLYCYHYNPMTGRYGLAIMRALRLSAVATVLALGTFIVLMVRRERAR
jgi:protein SCO1/2